jgi:type I restriction enzyme S subunit
MELMEYFLVSVFLGMFGDPATNPKGWVLEKMGLAIAEARCGPFGSALHKSEYAESGVPVWGIDNVQPNRFVESESLFITKDKFKELTSYEVKVGMYLYPGPELSDECV